MREGIKQVIRRLGMRKYKSYVIRKGWNETPQETYVIWKAWKDNARIK